MLSMTKLSIALCIIIPAIMRGGILKAAVAGEELLELGCGSDRDCREFLRPREGIHASCIEGNCVCRDAGGEHADCTPRASRLTNIIGGHCPCTQPHAECNVKEDICHCKHHYMRSADRRRCIPKTTRLGEKCELDLQCEATNSYAVCASRMENKVCRCREGFMQDDGECLSIVGHNANCSDSDHCKNFGAHTDCEQGRCVCDEDYVSASDKKSCLRSVRYGQSCTENVQCLRKLGTGGKCIAGECRCGEKHFARVIVQANETEMDSTMESEEDETDEKEGYLKKVCARVVERGEYCRYNKDCYQHQLPDAEQTMSCYYGECNCNHDQERFSDGNCTRSSSGAQPNFKKTLMWGGLVGTIYEYLSM